MLSTMIPSSSMETSKNQLPTNKTFAEAVKEPAIIIKPVQEQTSNTTINDIQTRIDPTKLAVGINTMKSTRDGGVVISCTDKKSMETMKNKVIEELGDKYTINMTQLKNPRAIVVGVEEKIINMGEEDILEILTQQNELLKGEESKMKLIRKYVGRKESGNIVIEVEPEVMKKLISLEKIHVAFRNCRVYEYFNVLRCFNCGEFGHKNKDCKNDKVCFTCSKKHNGRCTSNKSVCINCKKMNEKVNLKLDINHSIFDRNCPCYERIVQSIRKKTKSYNS